MHVVVALVLAWGAFAFGAVYPWAYFPIAVAALGLCAWQMFSATRRTFRVTAVGVAACAVVLAVGLQLVPLSPERLAWVSPTTSQFMAVFSTRTGTPPIPRQPLSVAPHQTILALGALLAAIAWMIGVRRTITTRGKDIVRAIAATGALLAIVGLVQKATFNGKLLWFWTPEAPEFNGFGPFVNRNHFAGWMTLALAVTGGHVIGLLRGAASRSGIRNRLLWLTTPAAQPLVLFAGAMALMATSTVWTMSRSGLVASAVSLAVLAIAVATRPSTRRFRAVAVSFLALLVTAAVLWKGGSAIAGWYRNTDTLEWRFDLWRDSIAPLRAFWRTGAGMNAYSTLMTVYPLTDRAVQPTEAHNDYLQLAIEGGVFVAVPVVLLAAAVIRQIARRLKQPQDEGTWWIRMGAVAGLCGVAVQEMAEFSLQIAGVALLFATCLTIAMHDARDAARAHARRPRHRRSAAVPRTRPVATRPSVAAV